MFYSTYKVQWVVSISGYPRPLHPCFKKSRETRKENGGCENRRYTSYFGPKDRKTRRVTPMYSLQIWVKDEPVKEFGGVTRYSNATILNDLRFKFYQCRTQNRFMIRFIRQTEGSNPDEPFTCAAATDIRKCEVLYDPGTFVATTSTVEFVLLHCMYIVIPLTSY